MKPLPNQTPLNKVKNFGPVTRAEMESLRITSLEQIEELGFEEVCRLWVSHYPERLNANAFLGIICSIERTVWTQATPAQRRAAHTMANRLRQEYGIPAKKQTRRPQRR